MNLYRSMFIPLLFSALGSPGAGAEPGERVRFDTEDGGRIEATFFEAGRDQVVIFAHGAIFNKESWYFLAQALQRGGVAALCLDFRGYGNSTAGSSPQKLYDILGAIDFVKARQFTDISLVGGSMGGAAILAAMDRTRAAINKVVLLAPAGGPPMASKQSDKLFVVAENERMFNSVMAIYTASAEPKRLKTYPGDIHAQNLFRTDAGGDLADTIVNFISPDKP